MSDRMPDRSRRPDAPEPQDRSPRSLDTRATRAAPTPWRPPSLLPDPAPEPGYVFRWVRTAINNSADNTNASRQFREGYVPVRAEDHPELMLATSASGPYAGNVEVGGLLLCKIPAETARQRAAYYSAQSHAQMEGVENSYLRESDPRMPVLRPERSSRASFGTGARA